MKIALITGSNGLVGSEAALYFAAKGFKIVGIDNDLRKYFFGKEASTSPMAGLLKEKIKGYIYQNVDIRNRRGLEKIFGKFNRDIKVIIHAAAQPSHDWAAKEPFTDFGVNAGGTLNLLESARKYCQKAVFILVSTNKVYGDSPNRLPLVESATRWEIRKSHPYYNGIDEKMSIDASKHSLFGASKLAADILTQEYGRYFGMKTVCFRAGCLTGPNHKAAMLHGFLAYLIKCCAEKKTYNIFGYGGKQVRDNLHGFDLAAAFYQFYKNPRPGEVYNIGGGRENSCSILEAIDLIEGISGQKLKCLYRKEPRPGDHLWYISSLKKFKRDYPAWKKRYNLKQIVNEIYSGLAN